MIFNDIKLNEHIKNYELKFLKNTDLEIFISLFKQVFNKNWDKKYWDWFFFKNPYETITITLWNNDKLVGSNCGQKKVAIINGRKFDCIIITNTMVHNDYRGQGIFTYISQNLYNKLAELGFTFLYGFPNEYYNCKLYKKESIAWDFCTKKTMLIKHIKNISYIKTNFKKKQNFSIVKIEIFPNEVNNLNNNENKGIILEKSARYLNWRYTEHPYNKYDKFLIYDKQENLCGYFVLKTYVNKNNEKFGEIDDIFTNNNNFQILSYIYEYILQNFINKKNDYISTWLGQKSKLYSFFKENQFNEIEMNTSWGFKILQEMENKNKLELLDPKNWNLRMGDSDVF